MGSSRTETADVAADQRPGRLPRAVPADSGIAGHVYSSGKSYFSADVSSDPRFYRGVDEAIQYRTESLVAIPIRGNVDSRLRRLEASEFDGLLLAAAGLVLAAAVIPSMRSPDARES